MPMVGSEIIKMVIFKVTFLPKRSPRWPRRIEPSGRIKNPIAKIKNVDNRALIGLSIYQWVFGEEIADSEMYGHPSREAVEAVWNIKCTYAS